jgi:hypothetical protein
MAPDSVRLRTSPTRLECTTSGAGHSRPMHSVPVPINVRCYSNNDVIVRRSDVTQRANFNRARRGRTDTN